MSSEVMSHVARSLTQWEFMMLKHGRGHTNAEQAKVAEILSEFSELHRKVKAMSHSVLISAKNSKESEGRDTSKHVMVKYFSADDYLFSNLKYFVASVFVVTSLYYYLYIAFGAVG